MRPWQAVCELGLHRRGEIRSLKTFLADESGATAIEYGPIAAGIALAIITVVNGMGNKLNAKVGSISASVK